jgi:hypothetical protein
MGMEVLMWNTALGDDHIGLSCLWCSFSYGALVSLSIYSSHLTLTHHPYPLNHTLKPIMGMEVLMWNTVLGDDHTGYFIVRLFCYICTFYYLCDYFSLLIPYWQVMGMEALI